MVEHDLYLNAGTTIETEPISMIEPASESETTTIHRSSSTTGGRMYVTTLRDNTTPNADMSSSLSPHHGTLAGVSGTLLESGSTTLFPATVTSELTTKPTTSQVCLN